MDNRDERYDRTAAELRRRRRAREAREKRRKALFKRRAMIVGGGVLAVALVVGLIALAVNLISSGSKPQVASTVAPTSASQTQNAVLPGTTTGAQGAQTSNNTQVVNGNGSSGGYNNGYNNADNNAGIDGSNGDNYGSGETAVNNDSDVEYNTVAPYEEGQQNADADSQTGNQGGNASGNAAQSAQSGGQLHYYANGKTSYGWDWTYAGGDGLVDVACNYNTSTHQYDFVITGKQPGSGSVTLIYNTDDTQTASQTVSFTVDNNLNITGN